MRFGKPKADGLWFAWYPVKFSIGPQAERWVWLEHVWRKRYQSGPNHRIWQYEESR